MADSTYPLVIGGQPGTWPERWNAERRLRRAVRKELTAGIDARCVDAVMGEYKRDAAPHGDARRLAVLHIACQAALTLGWVWEGRRPMWNAEASTFRMLGGLAARAGLSEPEVIAAATSGVEGAIAAAHRGLESGTAPWRTQLAILDHLKAEAEPFAGEAKKELREGMRTPPPSDEDKASVLLHLLDGRLPDDQLGAAASRAGLDATREYGLVLLVHATARAEPLEAAAREIEATISGAVDLGLSDTRPAARRVVFPVLTHGRWIEARTSLHEIATLHGLLAIAPIPAPRLGDLRATYRVIERDLARVIEGCGYSTGIIDPACVGPVCAGEGMSPAPAEDWSSVAPAAVA